MQALPTFAPFNKKLIFSDQLIKQALELQTHSTPDPITYENGISRHDPDGVLTNYLNMKNLSVHHKSPSGKLHIGDFDGFRSFNLTYIKDSPLSKTQQFYSDGAGGLKAFLFETDRTWVWRDDIDCLEFQKFLAQFSITKTSLVRLIYLNPPAVGGVHIDTSPLSMQKYYQAGGISLTFNLLPGDASLYFLKNQTVHQIDSSLSAWHFDPSTPHSVGLVNKPRVQLRVFGQMNPGTYSEMLDFSSAI